MDRGGRKGIQPDFLYSRYLELALASARLQRRRWNVLAHTADAVVIYTEESSGAYSGAYLRLRHNLERGRHCGAYVLHLASHSAFYLSTAVPIFSPSFLPNLLVHVEAVK